MADLRGCHLDNFNGEISFAERVVGKLGLLWSLLVMVIFLGIIHHVVSSKQKDMQSYHCSIGY
jgi:hypothetical protein